MSLKMSI